MIVKSLYLPVVIWLIEKKVGGMFQARVIILTITHKQLETRKSKSKSKKILFIVGAL